MAAEPLFIDSGGFYALVSPEKEAIQRLLDTGREEAFRLDPKAETAELLPA